MRLLPSYSTLLVRGCEAVLFFVATAYTAHAIELNPMKGHWVSDSGAAFITIDITPDSDTLLDVSLPTTQGKLSLSDGTAGSNVMLSGVGLRCFYYVEIIGQKMIWDLKSGDPSCIHSSSFLKHSPAVEILQQGDVFAAHGDFDTAIAKYTQAATSDPDYPPVYKRQGDAQFYQRDYVHAIRNYSKAIAKDNTYADAYMMRGRVHLAVGELDDAIKDLSSALASSPGNIDVLNLRGDAYLAVKEYPSALADFSAAIEINPNAAPAYIGRGDAYTATGELSKARSDYTRAIQLEPSYEDTIKQRLRQIDTVQQSLDARLNQATAALDAAESKIITLQSDITKKDSDLGDATAKIAGTQHLIDKLTKQTQNQATTIDNLTTELNNSHSALSALNDISKANVDSVYARLTHAENDIVDLTKQVTSYKQIVDSLNSQLNDTAKKTRDQATTIGDLTNQLATSHSNYATLVDTSNKHLADVSTQLQQAQSAIAELTQQITSYKDIIGRLRDQQSQQADDLPDTFLELKAQLLRLLLLLVFTICR